MPGRERYVATGLVLLMLVLWLGFAVHASSRFPGTLAGGTLAIVAAVLMGLVPAVYSAVKRIRRVRAFVTRHLAMRTLLTWHVYTATVGAILALLHTAHKFESSLGIALTTTMLLTVISGYIGRHFFTFVSMELNEKQTWLAALREAYDETARQVAGARDPLVRLAAEGRVGRGIATGLVLDPEVIGGESNVAVAVRAVRLAETMADVEYAIATHERLKGRSSWWLRIHLVVSLLFYVLLALHVWAGIYFGLRWLP
ncbi:MAG TPA: hypothetical protein VI485_03205 [Vicinamibacterales bacterium]|nr:hypothetical protein [Vicinamibacterales bacterium]